ncbi:MAG: hypothetical protein V2A34_06995, partial [Lentisphaerota bacterium]
MRSWTKTVLAGMLAAGFLGMEALAAEEAAPAAIGWQNDCSKLDGWRSKADDPGMNCKIENPEPSVMKVTQDGEGTWGKVSFFVSNVDLEKYPELVVKVNKVELNSAYTIQIAPSDWSEFITVIPRCSADGKRDDNLKKAIKTAKNPDAFGNP